MHLTRKRTAIVAGIAGAGAAGALGLAVASGPAQAEDPSPAPSASTSASPGGAVAPGRPDRAAERAQRQDELATALAAELGIDKAKVAAALAKVEADRQAQAKADRIADLKTRLDAAVKAGTLTAEQESAILKAAEAGVLPEFGRAGRHGR